MGSSVLRQNRRHRGYRLLLLNCLLVLMCLMLPRGLRQLSAVGYLAMPLVLFTSLGGSLSGLRWSLLRTRLYQLITLVTFAASFVWYFNSAAAGQVGLPLLFLWTALVAWSCQRLIANLAKERTINRDVLTGALAGYLLLGLAAGLLFSVLETVAPGSFAGSHSAQGSVLQWQGSVPPPTAKVWSIDFVQLNYFAFITLTTTGYGDIHPVAPQSQILSVMVAVTGTVYLALVMGLLISRYTVQDVEEEINESLVEGEDQG